MGFDLVFGLTVAAGMSVLLFLILVSVAILTGVIPIPTRRD